MKILAIAHEPALNGASKSLLDVLEFLNQTDKIILIVPFKHSRIEEEAKKRNISVLNVEYHKWMAQKIIKKDSFMSQIKWIIKYPVMWHLYYKWKNRKTFINLARYVEQEKIDLLYTNTRVIDLGAQLNRLTGIPHVWHIREFGEEDFKYVPFTNYKRHWDFISKYSNAVIVNSHAVEKKFRRVLSENLPIKMIYNGVDNKNEYMHSFDKDFKKQPVNFLISGRISEAKGQGTLIEAIRILIKRNEKNFMVYFAGQGNIETLNVKLDGDLEQHCVFLGQVENMTELRKKMDVELMCSRAEAFGRVTVEAMMSSLAVIGSASGGTKELIEDGITGLLYTPEDAEDLADKMQRLIDHPEKIQVLAQAAYPIAITCYSKDSYCENVAEYIRKVYKNSNECCKKDS